MTFRLVCLNHLNWSISAASPGPPGPVLCSVVSGTFIRVEWTPPTSLGGRTDTYYIVEYQAISSIGNFIASRPVFGTTYTISRLESITQYRVEVYSENGVSDQDTRPGIRSTRMNQTVCTTGEGGVFTSLPFPQSLISMPLVSI